MPALDFIPAGSQYDNLRGALLKLQELEAAGYGNLYSGLSDGRVQGWIDEIDSGTGRDADQIRDDIVQYVIGSDLAREAYGITTDQFQQLILGGNEGGLNLGSLTIRAQPESSPTPDPPTSGDPATPPEPEPTPSPTPEPVDFKARVRALYPWLPDNLVQMFADEWADTGDPQLALATVRTSKEYEDAFPGIKRDDGSLRMTEAEWFSTREAYSSLFREYGLNDQLFADRFTALMEGDVSPQELAGRLGGAFEMIQNNIPEVSEAFSDIYGVNGQAPLFASFIDPDLGQAILDRRVSVAQVAGEGRARGFDADTLAGRLVSGGVDQSIARNFFVQAEGQLQTLDDLAARHRDPDDTFDLEEFAEANVFGDATQTRRIRRLLRAEASTFTDQLGTVAVGSEGALTGLSPR